MAASVITAPAPPAIGAMFSPPPPCELVIPGAWLVPWFGVWVKNGVVGVGGVDVEEVDSKRWLIVPVETSLIVVEVVVFPSVVVVERVIISESEVVVII